MGGKTKLIAGSFVLVAVSVVGVVMADYFALFGTSKTVELEFFEARFRTVDEDTGNLIFGAGVRCFQRKNFNACTLRDSHQAGVVAVHFPLKRITEKSLFFTLSSEVEKASNPEMNMMFIHNNYSNTKITMMLDELFANPGKEYTVEMPARYSTSTEAQES